MAIHAKRVGPNQGTFITADGNIVATDLQMTTADGTVFQSTVSKIERVMNYTGGNITVDGHTFAPGDWDFSHTGGFDLGSNLTAVAISGGMVTLRA